MYSYPTTKLSRERNLAGGGATGDGLVITAPNEIAGTSVTVFWDMGGETADTFRVTIGSSPTASDIADTGIYIADISTMGEYTWTNLVYPSTIAFITVYRRYRDGDFKTTTRSVPITYVDPTPGYFWDDNGVWDDTEYWIE